MVKGRAPLLAAVAALALSCMPLPGATATLVSASDGRGAAASDLHAPFGGFRYGWGLGATRGLRGKRMELFGMRRTVGDLKGMRGGASMDAAETNGVGPDDVKSYEEVRELVEEIRARVPTDAEMACDDRADVPLESSIATQAALRATLASFQVTVEGADELRAASEAFPKALAPCVSCHADCGVWHQGVMDCARAGQEQEDEYGAVGLLQRFWDGSEEREEDEYGAVGLLQRFWDGSEDAAPRVEKAGLLRRPEAGEGKGWVPRAALANERLLALAASWPERCGAHRIRGLPAVQPLHNPSAPLEAAKAVYSSLYFQQRLAGILELVCSEEVHPGLPPIAFLLSLLLPMSTAARLLSALQTDARFLKGFWHPSGDVLREKAGILAKDIEEAVPGWRGVLAADEPALQSLAEGWLSSLFVRVFSPVQAVRLLDHLLSLESSRDDAPGGVEAATPATAARDARVMSYLCGVGVALAKDLQHGSRLDETVLKELRGEGGVSGLGEGGFAGLDEVLDAAGTSAAESLHS